MPRVRIPPRPPTHPTLLSPPTLPPYRYASPLCRYGMMECVLAAQEGGCGLIVYSRQEGNALGEVAKLLTLSLTLTPSPTLSLSLNLSLCLTLSLCLKLTFSPSPVPTPALTRTLAPLQVAKFLVHNAREQAPGGDSIDNFFSQQKRVSGADDVRSPSP